MFQTVQRWVAKFRCGKYAIKDKQKTGRKAIVHPDIIKKIVDGNPCINVTELYVEFNIGRTTVKDYLVQADLTNVNKMWVPKNLSAESLEIRLESCKTLLSRFESDPFLDRVVFEGEKVIYYNIYRKNKNKNKEPVIVPDEKTVATTGMKPFKIVLQFWWDREGVIFYKFIGDTELKETEYLSHLDQLQAELFEKRPYIDQSRLILHHSASFHIADKAAEKIASFGWSQLIQPRHSPDFSPTNYCLIQYFMYSIHLQFYTRLEEVELFVFNFFDSRKPRFFSDGVDNLPARWREIISRNGGYIETNEKIQS